MLTVYIIIILFVILFFIKRKKRDYVKLKIFQYRLMKLFYALDQVCNALNIEYCIESGTLLGAVRHENMIPWDDDIDVQMKKEGIDKLMKNLDKIREMGYNITFDDKIYRFKYLKNEGNEPFIDIFQVDIKENKVHYYESRNKNRWPKYYFYMDEKYPLKLYKFGKLYVPGPNNPYPYLERSYGKDWSKPKVWNGHHSF